MIVFESFLLTLSSPDIGGGVLLFVVLGVFGKTIVEKSSSSGNELVSNKHCDPRKRFVDEWRFISSLYLEVIIRCVTLVVGAKNPLAKNTPEPRLVVAINSRQIIWNMNRTGTIIKKTEPFSFVGQRRRLPIAWAILCSFTDDIVVRFFYGNALGFKKIVRLRTTIRCCREQFIFWTCTIWWMINRDQMETNKRIIG